MSLSASLPLLDPAQAIYYTLINEYTDWTRPLENAITLLDSLIELLGDALIVAPAIESLDHHYLGTLYSSPSGRRYLSASSPFGSPITGTTLSSGSTSPTAGGNHRTSRSYFYVFSHQNEEQARNRYHERLGCVHGEELAYLFGLPLLGSALDTADLYSYRPADCRPDYPRSVEPRATSAKTLAAIEDEEAEEEEEDSEEGEDEDTDESDYPTLDIGTNSYLNVLNFDDQGRGKATSKGRFNYTEADVDTAMAMITYWVHFATFG